MVALRHYGGGGHRRRVSADNSRHLHWALTCGTAAAAHAEASSVLPPLRPSDGWISLRVNDALDPVVARPAGKVLALVIETVIHIGATPRQRHAPSAIRTEWSIVRTKLTRLLSLRWHSSRPPTRYVNKSLVMCREVGGRHQLFGGRMRSRAWAANLCRARAAVVAGGPRYRKPAQGPVAARSGTEPAL
jgi:hypothetical protein